MMLQFVLLITLAFWAPADAQVVAPSPIFDCSNTNFQVIYTACSAGDYHHCCAVGSDCCAGGCCDLLSWCVGAGTSKETCCDISDVTRCDTGPIPQPSVICTGGNGLSSYKCPPGATCNSRDDSCFLPEGSDSSSSIPQSFAPSSEPSPSTIMPTTVVVTVSASTPSTTMASSQGATTIVVTLGGSSSEAQPTVTTTVGDSNTLPTIDTSIESPSVPAVTVTVSPSASSTKSAGISHRLNGFWLGLTLMVSIIIHY
ncbi:hypothetical protein F5Y19DRAFT_487226 [Xylariaceae sp. FL1651]|nr:hypothetical protein F5Y19DRAFT_487226 [Xylariaceae sp. FL1651]